METKSPFLCVPAERHCRGAPDPQGKHQRRRPCLPDLSAKGGMDGGFVEARSPKPVSTISAFFSSIFFIVIIGRGSQPTGPKVSRGRPEWLGTHDLTLKTHRSWGLSGLLTMVLLVLLLPLGKEHFCRTWPSHVLYVLPDRAVALAEWLRPSDLRRSCRTKHPSADPLKSCAGAGAGAKDRGNCSSSCRDRTRGVCQTQWVVRRTQGASKCLPSPPQKKKGNTKVNTKLRVSGSPPN